MTVIKNKSYSLKSISYSKDEFQRGTQPWLHVLKNAKQKNGVTI